MSTSQHEAGAAAQILLQNATETSSERRGAGDYSGQMKLFAEEKCLEGIQGPALPTLAKSESIQIQFLVVAGRLQNNSYSQSKIKLTSPLPVLPA